MRSNEFSRKKIRRFSKFLFSQNNRRKKGSWNIFSSITMTSVWDFSDNTRKLSKSFNSFAHVLCSLTFLNHFEISKKNLIFFYFLPWRLPKCKVNRLADALRNKVNDIFYSAFDKNLLERFEGWSFVTRIHARIEQPELSWKYQQRQQKSLNELYTVTCRIMRMKDLGFLLVLWNLTKLENFEIVTLSLTNIFF